MPKPPSHEPVEQSSDNIFADLGFPNAGEHLVKAKLVYKIDVIMKKRRLKQVEAARLFGILQPDVSKMLRGEFRQFSVERLMRFWWRWGRMSRSSSDLTVAPKRRPRFTCSERNHAGIACRSHEDVDACAQQTGEGSRKSIDRGGNCAA